MTHDNKAYSGWSALRADFTAMLLGTVFAVCRVVDHVAAREAGMQRPEALPG